MATAKKTTKTAAKKVAVKKEAPAKKVAVKKVAAVTPAPAKKVAASKEVRYLYAVGRRKTAVAQVRLYPVMKAEEATVVVNERESKAYFGTVGLTANAVSPLKVAGLEESFRVSLLVRGGGINGQSDAAKLAVARALLKHDILLRPILKSNGLLTRDARSVERKKPGLKKARRSPQWSKR